MFTEEQKAEGEDWSGEEQEEVWGSRSVCVEGEGEGGRLTSSLSVASSC